MTLQSRSSDAHGRSGLPFKAKPRAATLLHSDIAAPEFERDAKKGRIMKNSKMQIEWLLVLALTSFACTTANAQTNNTSYGLDALQDVTTGTGNAAFGAYTLLSDTSGGDNSAVGYNALLSNTTGANNTAFGFDTLVLNVSGFYNTAVGAYALEFNTSSSNTAVGYGALMTNAVSCCNVAVGNMALANSDAGANTAVGNNAGKTADSSTISGKNNTFLGTGTTLGTGNLTNATALGANAEVDASNSLVLGSVNGKNGQTVTVKVGIGTTSPDNNLTVNGTADKPGGGSWGTYSDGRLKTLHGNFQSGLSQILKINPVRYRYKQGNAMGIQDTDEHIGLVAQEVQKVIPEAVTKNSRGYLLVNNDPILWAMLNSIKEQQSLIQKQRAEIDAQQARLKAQRYQVRAQQDQDQIQEAQILELTSQMKTIQTSLNFDGRNGRKIRTVKARASIVQQ